MIQYNLVNVHFIEPEFSLTMALIPTVVMVLVLSVYFVRYENKIGTIIVIVSIRLSFLSFFLFFVAANRSYRKTDLLPRYPSIHHLPPRRSLWRQPILKDHRKGHDATICLCSVDLHLSRYSLRHLLPFEL